MELSEGRHMARLSSLITAAVVEIKRYLCAQRCGGGAFDICYGTLWGNKEREME